MYDSPLAIFVKIIISALISFIIIFPVLGFNSGTAIASMFILFLLIYFTLSTFSNDNKSNDLPSTLYPNLPHTGLDGISLDSYVAGLDLNNK
jgi:branched-subunit amino acid ABC-type transport system permease component